MSLDLEHRLAEIRGAARDFPLQDRAMFLERACRGETELRRQAETLFRPPQPARDSAGKSVRPRLRWSDGWSLTAILVVLAGCTPYRTEPPKATAGSWQRSGVRLPAVCSRNASCFTASKAMATVSASPRKLVAGSDPATVWF